MSEQKRTLAQKLVAIRESIDFFSKDTKSYNYSYVSGTQILKKIKSKIDEEQVLLFPSMGDLSDETYNYKTNKGKEQTDFIVKGKMTYTWMNAENPSETIDIPWMLYGQQDDISKAYGTGLTYSERYFLLKFFGIATDDDDPDAKQTGGNQQGNYNNNSQPKKATDNQLNLVDDLIRKNADKHSKEWKDVYEGLKGKLGTQKDMENFTSQEASKAITLLKKWLEQNQEQGA